MVGFAGTSRALARLALQSPAFHPAAILSACAVSPFQPMLHGDDLRRILIQQQEDQSRDLGLPSLASRISRYKFFARIAEVDLWERVILNPFPPGSRPRGLIADLERVLAGILDLKVQRVQVLRKQVLSYRRQRHGFSSSESSEPR